MGIETAALLIGGGSSIASGILNYGEQRAARKRTEKNQDAAVGLTQGPNAVDQLIMGQLSKPNSGQDGFMQYLRSTPGALKPYLYDQSAAFKGLQANDQFNINDQVNQLSAGAGSLGARFGSGFAAHDAMLRSRFAAGISARNAGISQSSFNTALQAAMSGYGMQQSQNNGLLGLLLQSQQGRTQAQLAARGLASAPLPGTAQSVGQSGIDVAQLMLLGKYFGGGAGTTTPPIIGSSGGFNPWVY
jgi:hypothetical protein